jgi:DNA-binding NarL/FixJ family response regulator
MTGSAPAAADIRVVLCDDHAMVRSGLRLLLDAEPGIRVVGEASTAEEVVEEARLLTPDVVVLDVILRGRSGLDALPDLVAAAPAARVLMLSMQDDPTYVRAAFAAGAAGYLPQEAPGAELVEAIREVAGGRSFVDPGIGARLALRADDDDGGEQPSERERDVLRLLALGYTNKEIARQLGISVRTVESHRASIARKLGLTTRAAIVRYAFSTGELQLPPAAAI